MKHNLYLVFSGINYDNSYGKVIGPLFERLFTKLVELGVYIIYRGKTQSGKKITTEHILKIQEDDKNLIYLFRFYDCLRGYPKETIYQELRQPSGTKRHTLTLYLGYKPKDEPDCPFDYEVVCLASEDELLNSMQLVMDNLVEFYKLDTVQLDISGDFWNGFINEWDKWIVEQLVKQHIDERSERVLQHLCSSCIPAFNSNHGSSDSYYPISYSYIEMKDGESDVEIIHEIQGMIVNEKRKFNYDDIEVLLKTELLKEKREESFGIRYEPTPLGLAYYRTMRMRKKVPKIEYDETIIRARNLLDN